MAVSVTLTKIDKRPDGQVWVSWSDGTTQYFGSLADVKAVGEGFDSVDGAGLENAKMLALKWWQARSPELTNTNLIVGKKLTLDLSSTAPIKVQ